MTRTPKRLLITGGAGFIGSALIRFCIRETSDLVLNVDKLTYAANLDNLKEVLPSGRYALIQADVADPKAMRKALQDFQPDAILHLAAESHVDRSIDEPLVFVQTNTIGTSVLLNAARAYWEELSGDRRKAFRFMHVSTDEVFGSLGNTGSFTEETPYAPNSPYSASKASSDMLVRAWNRTYGLPTLISNCSNNYGPYQFPEKLLPTVMLAALDGRAIPVYGRGENVRDWLFVNDHVAALLRILESGEPGQTYNVGGNAEHSNLDVVRSVCGLLDDMVPASPHRPHEKLITFVADRPGHDLRYAIDATKIRRDLGWCPQTEFEDGLRQTISWYLANRWWVDAIKARGFKADRLGRMGSHTL